MKIKTIEPTASRLGRVRLVFEDDKKMMVYPTVVGDLCLYAGKELSEADLAEIEQAEGRASAKNRAVRMVAAGSVSKSELRQRLLHKGERPEDAEQAVAWLDDLKLLNDAETAKELVQRAVRKGYGPARIRQILYEKRIPKQYWEQAMQDLPAMDDAIDAFLANRFRGADPDEKTVKRAVDAALRRGHSYADIRAALRRYQDGLAERWEEDT